MAACRTHCQGEGGSPGLGMSKSRSALALHGFCHCLKCYRSLLRGVWVPSRAEKRTIQTAGQAERVRAQPARQDRVVERFTLRFYQLLYELR